MEGAIFNGRFHLVQKIGQGAFGEIYSAKDLTTDEMVALKVEHNDCKKPVLRLEVNVLRKLQDCKYVGRYICYGQDADCTYMAMELLSSNISELRRQQPQGRFSVSTSCRLAMQMTRAIEAVHRLGYLHRDVKPSNFVLGRVGEAKRRVFIVDFGLARRFLSPDGRIRPKRETAGFRGTARYASIHSHLNEELSRRDDLWSLLYIVIEFLKGVLPWRKIKEKELIGKMKMQYNHADLVRGLPTNILKFMEHIDSLKYPDIPDYDYVYNLFDKCIPTDDDGLFDWERGSTKPFVSARTGSSTNVLPGVSPAMDPPPRPNSVNHNKSPLISTQPQPLHPKQQSANKLVPGVAGDESRGGVGGGNGGNTIGTNNNNIKSMNNCNNINNNNEPGQRPPSLKPVDQESPGTRFEVDRATEGGGSGGSSGLLGNRRLNDLNVSRLTAPVRSPVPTGFADFGTPRSQQSGVSKTTPLTGGPSMNRAEPNVSDVDDLDDDDENVAGAGPETLLEDYRRVSNPNDVDDDNCAVDFERRPSAAMTGPKVMLPPAGSPPASDQIHGTNVMIPTENSDKNHDSARFDDNVNNSKPEGAAIAMTDATGQRGDGPRSRPIQNCGTASSAHYGKGSEPTEMESRQPRPGKKDGGGCCGTGACVVS